MRGGTTLAKQPPKQTPAEEERGSMARPPWLPGEKKRRRVHLGRGKQADTDPEIGEDDAPDRAANGHGPPKDEDATVVAPASQQSPPQSDAPEEGRPKRVAVPFDRIRRLQQLDAGPHPAPGPRATQPSFPPNRVGLPPVAEPPRVAAEPQAPGEPEQSPAEPAPIASDVETPPEPPSTSIESMGPPIDEPEPQPAAHAAPDPLSPEWVVPPVEEPELDWSYEALSTSLAPESASPEWIPPPVDQSQSAAESEPVSESEPVEVSTARDWSFELPSALSPTPPAAESFSAEWAEQSPVDDSEPTVESKPVEVSTARDWSFEAPSEPSSIATPAPVEAEPAVESETPVAEPEPSATSTTQDWSLEVPAEPPPTAPPPAVDETESVVQPKSVVAEAESSTGMPEQPSGSGELDEIEARAAALLEQMAAKRAQVSAPPEPTEIESISVDDSEAFDEPDAEAPNWLSSDFVSAVDEPVDPSSDAVADLAESAQAVGDDERAEAATVVTAEEPAASDGPDGPAEAEDDTKVAPVRRPAPPPWQMPSPIMSAEIEEVVVDPPEESPPPAPEYRETPASQSDLPPPRPQFRPPLPPAGLPPWPLPPPPGPFPPPPWWPGPPPGRRLAPKARPAAAAPAPVQPPPPRPAPPPVAPPYQPLRVPPSIDEAEITDPGRFAPPSGWRRAVHKATSGHVNPGASRKERRQEHLLAEIRQPIVGDFRIAVLSIKGGVGKTTTTFGLGSALATVRHDRVIAVDANPDRGTLGERVGDASTRSTVRDLLSDPNIHRYADVRNHTLMATSRLEVLASEQDPAVSEVFGAADYRRTVDILRHFYNIILTDCGTGIMHSAMSAILDLAHSIVLVSSPAIDAARSASATLDWLVQHGHSGLVREAHVVLSASRPGSAALKLDKVYEHFQSRCRSIHLIPFDPHLAEGADVDFGRLNPATRQAYLELAGSVAENFGRLRAPRE
ncbi:MinD/ParA family ATP-binding protein [Mycobacterium asiaticum]|uniref:CobQ/CobB/MinD/ParA nucleotide binding domain-containing protein n=1 Tax=Mycobacterium asiaticum TaxID=1790 RepID=A0A1A3KJB2_MYCAS|nr:MinD/ParA family protein [Mycobacterium asiaticum]OBJ84534.1 hypothetical protein A5640_15525 [Mycobacterium asiaticum]